MRGQRPVFCEILGSMFRNAFSQLIVHLANRVQDRCTILIILDLSQAMGHFFINLLFIHLLSGHAV